MSKMKVPAKNVKGTRDFSPKDIAKRQYIFETIKKVFVKYGFQPIETPTMELLSTLTGKYGDEGDQLLFKVLNSGDFLKKAKSLDDSKKLTFEISEKGLRYDLTVPFARYVVQHQHEISFPFKRFQIQPVWRADRPQKGRYREFFQCDVDVVGSSSLLYEVELIKIYDEVFTDLNIDATIMVNHRGILAGIADSIGELDNMMNITVAIDKLDKIGQEGVQKELISRGLNESQCEQIFKCLDCISLEAIEKLISQTEDGRKGIEELTYIFNKLGLSTKNTIKFDASLARGLSYYTGTILEVKANDVQMGSIGGGGRYDNLTENFGLKNMPGVGCSFGAERIFDVLEELDDFPQDINASSVKVLFLNFDEASENYCFEALNEVRKAGISSEIYPDSAKLKKQMKYANSRQIPHVVLAGSEEIENNSFTLKEMFSGEQKTVSLQELIDLLKAE